MKKLLSLLLALAMVLGLAACGSAPAAKDETPAAPAQEAEKTDETPAEPAAPAEGDAETPPEFPEMTLKYSVNYAESNVYADGDKLMKKMVEEATGGKVKIDIYYSSSLFPQDQEIASMMSGDLDMCATGPSWLAEYVPFLNTLQAAYVFNNYDHWYRFYFESDTWKDCADKIAEQTNTRFLAAANNGSRCINLTTDKKVSSRADLAGVRLRMPTAESWLFMGEALGASPVPIPYPDLYLSLQTNACDGQDNPIAAVKDQSFYEVTKCVTLTQHYIADQYITIREDLWQSFSPELQAIFQEAALAACNYVIDTCHAQEEETIKFLEDNGLTIYRLSNEEAAAFKKEVVDYYLADKEVTASWDMELLDAINALA